MSAAGWYRAGGGEGAISEPACARSGTTVEVPAEAAGARLRPRCRARHRVRLVVRPGSIPCCRPGPAARDPGSARSPPPSGPRPGTPQRPAPRRPTPGPERPAPRARSDRAPVQPVPETASTCRNSVALIGYVPAPDRQRVHLGACRSPTLPSAATPACPVPVPSPSRLRRPGLRPIGGSQLADRRGHSVACRTPIVADRRKSHVCADHPGTIPARADR